MQTSGPAAVDRLDRDVLGLSGLTHVIWLEGINDLGAGTRPTRSSPAIRILSAACTRAVQSLRRHNDLRARISGVDRGDNGPGHDASRKVLNNFIRTSGLFDGVEDFDAATLDPNTGNMRAEFLPNSQFTQLPWDYLHPNHAGYNAMGHGGRHSAVRTLSSERSASPDALRSGRSRKMAG